MSFLYNYVLMNYHYVKEEDIEEAIEITDDDLLIKFKDGRRILYDIFDNTERPIYYTSDDLTDEEMKREFSIMLRKKMRRKFINQDELAKLVGTSPVMISRYMNERVMPNYFMLKKLARALDCSVEDFYYRHY